MISKKTGNSIKARLLIAVLSVALVFTMMPLATGNAYAEDEPVVTDEQVESVGEEAVNAEEPADVDAVVEEENAAAEPEADAVEAKTEELTTKDAEESVLIKGNVLKQEKTVSASSLSSLIKEDVSFDGINRKGKRSPVKVFTGVYFDELINYIGLKDGAVIDHFVVTTSRIDPNSSANERTEMKAEWLMTAPNDEFGNGKAMLGFSWEGKDQPVDSGIRVFVGAFEGMAHALECDSSNTYYNHIANKPVWIEEIISIEVVGAAPGDVTSSAGSTYAVTSATDKTVALTKAKNTKKVTVPDTVVYKDETYKVTKVNANAFTGKKIRTVTLGTNIDTIAKFAFKKSKARTLIVKTKALTKKSVKGSLKKSKIKRVKVKVGTKKENRKFVKKYRKIFKKKNSGKRVKVRR